MINAQYLRELISELNKQLGTIQLELDLIDGYLCSYNDYMQPEPIMVKFPKLGV